MCGGDIALDLRSNNARWWSDEEIDFLKRLFPLVDDLIYIGIGVSKLHAQIRNRVYFDVYIRDDQHSCRCDALM